MATIFSGCQIIESPPNSDTAIYRLNDDATIGEVHNFLLSKMAFQGVNCITDDGRIDFDAIYSKSLANAKEYNIVDDLCENEEYIAFMKEFSAEVERIAYVMATDSAEKSCEDYLNDFLVQRTNLSETEIRNMFALSSSLIGSSNMNENIVDEYEDAFADLVDNSDLNADNKTYIKAVGSIAIRSNYYWYA